MDLFSDMPLPARSVTSAVRCAGPVGTVRLHEGDCLNVLRLLPAGSVDSVVTDPPYGLSFMNKAWDHGVPSVAIWLEVLRVLKPGGHLLSFAGTRTQHRMACAIEDAGFEIRDTLMWMYGCLDEQTDAATINGVMPYHKLKEGDLVLCYDPLTGSYGYQPVQEVLVYDYSDTAYRLVGDFGEQVVSRNHRCIVERHGKEAFLVAEEAAWEREVRVPFLESLSDLHDALSDARQVSGGADEGVQQSVPQSDAPFGTNEACEASGPARRQNGSGMRRLSDDVFSEHKAHYASFCAGVQSAMQWGSARGRVESSCSQGQSGLGSGERNRAGSAYDRADQSLLEGRHNLPLPEGSLQEPANKICPFTPGLTSYGEEGWLCDGAPLSGGTRTWSSIAADRGSASPRPQRYEQCEHEPDALCHERGPQEVREWHGHKTALVRVVPFHHTGKVWCLRVPTGAFVAVRGGVAFPTGNSGFPKSLDVSKAIDKAAGAEREVIGKSARHVSGSADQRTTGLHGTTTFAESIGMGAFLTAPATPEAAQWTGWGTALKPAYEPVIMARAPLAGKTVAQNVLAHGCGGLNIDACRVALAENEDLAKLNARSGGKRGFASEYVGGNDHPLPPGCDLSKGRFPANVIHDGSEEVEAAFAAFGNRPSCNSPSSAAPVGRILGGSRSQGAIYPSDTGPASRFFYSAKATKADRAGSKHPTVKPIALMSYLCRLVTPPGGVVLDPFAGSGTTGQAALNEGFNAVLIEKEAEYCGDIRRRLAAFIEA